MKYISTLIVVIALLAVGTVNAQTASKLNGQSYTYVMKDINGMGPEIVDQITFGVGQVTSKELGKTGFSTGKVSEKNSGASSTFELTFTSPTKGTYLYTGTAAGTTIDATIAVTTAQGTSTMAFRGMLTEEWEHIQAEKEAARQKK